MKKDKHILINLTEADYNQLKEQADKEQRTLTNYAYILLIKALKGAKQ